MNSIDINYDIINLPEEEFVKYISDLDTDVNLITCEGSSLFFLLIDHDKLNLIKRLEGKLDLNNIHNHGLSTPLHIACWVNHYEIVEFLLERGVKSDPKDNEGMIPLHCCSDVRIAKLLLENGADINAKNNQDRSILDIQCFFGHIEMVKFLLENGVKIEYENGEPKCLSENNCEECFTFFEGMTDEETKEISDLILNYRMGKIKGVRKD